MIKELIGPRSTTPKQGLAAHKFEFKYDLQILICYVADHIDDQIHIIIYRNVVSDICKIISIVRMEYFKINRTFLP